MFLFQDLPKQTETYYDNIFRTKQIEWKNQESLGGIIVSRYFISNLHKQDEETLTEKHRFRNFHTVICYFYVTPYICFTISIVNCLLIILLKQAIVVNNLINFLKITNINDMDNNVIMCSFETETHLNIKFQIL